MRPLTSHERAYLQQRLDEGQPLFAELIPSSTLEGIYDYVLHHHCQGGFLTAVFDNDLFEAVTAADKENLARLVDICRFVYYYTPAKCRGSEKKVEAWLHIENV